MRPRTTSANGLKERGSVSDRRRDRLGDLGRALDRLDEALAVPPEAPLVVDGTIQRFEFTFELI